MDRVKRQRFKSIKKCSTCFESDSHENSNSSKSFDPISKLPQHLMIAILALVPLKCQLNSARHVSKPWAAAIQACLRPGLYLESMNSTVTSYFLNIQDHVNNGQKSERIDLGPPYSMGDIVATCNGMLLLSYFSRLTFVVNPILKCCFRIPPSPFSKPRMISSRSTLACVPRTTKFKVFLVDSLNVLGVHWYVFYVLRIGIDNTWKEIVRKESNSKCNYLCWKPVYNGDNDIYWITMDGVIVMDVDKEIIIREYPLPPPRVDCVPVPVFLWMGDCLSLIAGIGEGIGKTFQIYTLNMDSGKWTLYHEMGPFDYVAICGHGLGFDTETLAVMFRFWINDQIIFIVDFDPSFSSDTSLHGLKMVHFCYNVKTRQLTKIDGIAMGNFEAWLHTNTLAALPSTAT